MPINRVTATSVVTRRAERKPLKVSATQRKVNRRACAPVQWPRCSPNADNSIGEVSALSLNVEVLQLGAVAAGVVMMGSARPAQWPNGEWTGIGAKRRAALPCSAAAARSIDAMRGAVGCLSDNVPTPVGPVLDRCAPGASRAQCAQANRRHTSQLLPCR